MENSQRKLLGMTLVCLALYVCKKKMWTTPKRERKQSLHKMKRVGVNAEFFERIAQLVKIVVPGIFTREFLYIIALSLALVARTGLSIYLAGVNGAVVKGIINRDWDFFLRKLAELFAVALPASCINSLLTYLQNILALRFRMRLTVYFNKQYFDGLNFYKVTNLDERVPNPDHRLTQDIERWATSLSSLYSNFTKPLLDVILFSRQLARVLGWQGPTAVISWYILSAIVIRLISPRFSALIAQQQRLEGAHRYVHTRLVNFSEQVAFYRGSRWEGKKVAESFSRIVSHTQTVLNKRLYMGIFDEFMVKYGAVLVGYAVVGLPVFGPGSEIYLAHIGSDSSEITRDYVRNSGLLINLAKAIGRIVISYKELQNLAGYTSLVCEMQEVLDDLKRGIYQRKSVESTKANKHVDMTKMTGKVVRDDSIRFEHCPIITPNGDVLLEDVSFEVSPGMNVIVVGPNGCGKSSLFRTLGELWPVAAGVLHKPKTASIFYIPQRPYLALGTLRDQIIYPHTVNEMKARGVTDSVLVDLLHELQLEGLIGHYPDGLDAIQDWSEVLSGGDQQRIAMARVFYHKPQYAILDECTSAVSLDVEDYFYSHCRELGITLITIAHRPSLWRYHQYVLRMDGKGNWSFGSIESAET